MASRQRFAVPLLVVALIGGLAAAPALASASRPHLARETPQRLVAGVLDAHVGAISGKVSWAPDLGLPSLGGLTSGAGQGTPGGGGLDPASLLTTAQSFRLWADGGKQRLAATGALAETDVVRNGDQVWVWDSADQHVDHYTFAQAAGSPAGAPPAGPDPQTVAAGLLRSLEAAGTAVTVGRPVTVAGVPCQVLRLAPADRATSTVSSVEIAVDAANSAVLRVSVRAVGQSVPALQIGFSSVSFAPPPASVFTPPKGTTTTNHVVTPRSRQLAGQPQGQWYGYAPLTAGSPAPVAAVPPVRTIGHGWSSVLEVTPTAPSSSLTALRAAAEPVSGKWGSGRLLRSSLLDMAFLPDGRVLVGFVPPAVLEADAAAVGS